MNERLDNNVENVMSAEEIEKLAKKVSLLMTKPENTDTEVPILLLLKNKRLNAKSYKFSIGEDELNGIYPDMKTWPEEIQAATKEHLLGREVEVFLVSSDNVDGADRNILNELVKLRGKEIIPNSNPRGTLRREFYGAELKYTSKDGKDVTYYENGFHCPQTPDELISNLKAFGLLEQAKGIE